MNREDEQQMYVFSDAIGVDRTNASQNRAEPAMGETASYRLIAGGTVVNVRFRSDGSLTSSLARALGASL